MIEDNPADERSAEKCDYCNGKGKVCRCRNCGTIYPYIHKYSDCGNAKCEGEESDNIDCNECGGSGLDGTGAP